MEDNKVTDFILYILIVVYLSLLIYFKPWRFIAIGKKFSDVAFSIGLTVAFIALIVCCLGMLFRKNIARNLFLVLNFIYLLFGCFFVYTYWRFADVLHTMLSFISGPPKLIDKIKDTATPFLLGVVIPLVLFYYFLRPKVKSEFKKS